MSDAVVGVINSDTPMQGKRPLDFHGPFDCVELNEAAVAIVAGPSVHEEIERLKS